MSTYYASCTVLSPGNTTGNKTDFIAVHVIFPDWTEENKVNIVKMHQLSVTLNELVSLQNASHHLEPNMDLINLLTVSPRNQNLC